LEAEQPIPDALAAVLRPWLASKAPGQPLFHLSRTAEMIRHDMKAADIPDQTPSGRVDFHALRVAYISNLVASGASVKTCQTLARPSTPILTIGIYAKASLHDIRGAVDALPDLSTARPEREAAAATGTDPATPLTRDLAAPGQRPGDFHGLNV